MEYTDAENQVLSILDRTNFKNLSKDDFVGYVSKLNELRPEVAVKVLEQYPEFVNVIQSTMTEYKGTLEKIIESDDSSTKQCYEIYSKVLSDLGKCLNNPDLTPEERKDIREQEMEIARMAEKKETEKKGFNWKTVFAISTVVAITVVVGAGVLGVNIKLPKKS